MVVEIYLAVRMNSIYRNSTKGKGLSRSPVRRLSEEKKRDIRI
jgi:hypothetical protein